MKVRNFKDDLHWSLNVEIDEILNAYYLKKFDGVIRIEKVDGKTAEGLQNQKKGIDKVVHQTFERTITVDEKIRRKAYADIALEFFHAPREKDEYPAPHIQILRKRKPLKPGWAFKNHCDFVLYAILPTQMFYLLPQKLLTLTCRKHWQRWLKSISASPNPTYWSVNACVKVPDLFWCLEDEMIDKANEISPELSASMAKFTVEPTGQVAFGFPGKDI